MKQLSLDVLRTFTQIVELGSFKKAGEVLGRTQPAVTLQIQRLESQIGRRLFDKQGQRYQLNKNGEWLYGKAKQMLSINDGVFRDLEENSLQGQLKLGIPSEFASTLLPSIIGEFSQRYPDVTLDVTSALSQNLLSEQYKRQFDLILALVRPDAKPEAELLKNDELVWAGDASFALSQHMISLVLAPEGCIYRSRVIHKLKQQTQAWKISYTNPDLYGLIAAIKQGLGVTALAKSSLPKELDIIKDNRLPTLGNIDVCLFKQSTQHPQVSEALASYIRARIK
ncbi:LysR substrate-binding domain-containing protein [Agaribacter flavus]|uniref:LysR substrate-binding domain-containing protein n=1 Tax=Agaribacter flavus TaxID=1902781 RepID=A0ABV7FKT5_9ALTE